MKEKGLHIVWVCLYEISRKGKFTETKSNQMIVQGWRAQGHREHPWQRVSFWDDENVVKSRQWWGLHNSEYLTVYYKPLNHTPEMDSFYGMWITTFSSVQFSSVAQSCPTLCDPMNRSTPGLPVHHHLQEFTQTHVHRVSDAIQPSHPLLSPSPPAPNPSQHQSLFQWANSSHEVAKVLESQLQHHSFQRNPRADIL